MFAGKQGFEKVVAVNTAALGIELHGQDDTVGCTPYRSILWHVTGSRTQDKKLWMQRSASAVHSGSLLMLST